MRNWLENWLNVKWAILAAVFAQGAHASPEGGQAALRAAAATAIASVPATQPATELSPPPGMRAFFFDAPPWHGKPTRAFAYFGVPTGLKPGQTVPGVVLVHGGGGTAFANWVTLWTKRGYVAIAMDTCGQLPRKTDKASKTWDRDDLGGPAGWGGFEQVDDPPQDQWVYHATLDVINAHSLLRSFPEVDRDRTGVVGISWGGYLACIAAGLDDRFKFAIPVYGCGYIGEDSAWIPQFEKMGRERADQWLAAWDPSQYLPGAAMPMLWVDGTNDSNYPLEILQKSYRLPKGPRTLATRVRMKHNHSAGWAPEEIYAFADSVVKNGAPLANVTAPGRDGDRVWVAFGPGAAKVVKAEFNFTADDGAWKSRKWDTAAASADADGHRATAKLPAGTRAYYFNVIDERGLISSSECVEVR
jgi:dienelactone hydrolase